MRQNRKLANFLLWWCICVLPTQEKISRHVENDTTQGAKGLSMFPPLCARYTYLPSKIYRDLKAAIERDCSKSGPAREAVVAFSADFGARGAPPLLFEPVEAS